MKLCCFGSLSPSRIPASIFRAVMICSRNSDLDGAGHYRLRRVWAFQARSSRNRWETAGAARRAVMGWWDRPPSSLARQAVGISCNTRDAKLRMETVTFGQSLAGVNFISEFLFWITKYQLKTYRQRILETQPCETRSWREMTQGRIPMAAISTILWRMWFGRGRPLMKTPPSWLTRPWPESMNPENIRL